MKNTALEIVQLLTKHGHTAYYAGGAVRDMLMGHLPLDIDIATSATPEEVEKILEKTIPIGKEFGVILAIENGHHFEIATFREDSERSDGRRPERVRYADPETDALRRDFTINALFYDPLTEKIIDYVGGEKDLGEGIIRFVGDPESRIKEDALRIMRALRFAFRFGFEIDEDSALAIRSHAGDVLRTSFERIRDELEKMFAVVRNSPDPMHTFDDVIRILDEYGVLEHILPEISQMKTVDQPPEHHMEGDVFIHTMRCLASLDRDTPSEVVWGTMLHDVGKYECFKEEGEEITFHGHEEAGERVGGEVMRRFKYSRVFRDHVLWLVRHHMMVLSFEGMRETTRRKWFMHPWFLDLLAVMKADSVGTSPTNMDWFNSLERDYLDAKEQKLLIPPPKLLGGNDVKELFGIEEGTGIGEILEYVHELQIEGRITTREEAIEEVRKVFLGE
jgi:tRNA nucleotidyltransferase/poly(A) polymerase